MKTKFIIFGYQSFSIVKDTNVIPQEGSKYLFPRDWFNEIISNLSQSEIEKFKKKEEKVFENLLPDNSLNIYGLMDDDALTSTLYNDWGDEFCVSEVIYSQDLIYVYLSYPTVHKFKIAPNNSSFFNSCEIQPFLAKQLKIGMHIKDLEVFPLDHIDNVDSDNSTRKFFYDLKRDIAAIENNGDFYEAVIEIENIEVKRIGKFVGFYYFLILKKL